MLVLAAIYRRQNKLAAVWKSHPFTQPGPPIGLARAIIRTAPLRFRTSALATTRPFSRLSTYSLFLVLTLVTRWAAAVVITADFRALPHGLMIRTIRPGVEIPRPPGVQPLLVRVTANGLFIGSDAVALDALPARLEQELKRRPPDWPVYVEGDPDLEWRSVAEAIDANRGAHVDVVLVPGSRKRITRL